MAGTSRTTVGAVGGGDLKAAAEEIADGARSNALKAGLVETAGRIEVEVSGLTATISCESPAAYPAETRARHPLFGDREHWYGPPGERFLGPAADQRAGAAMARYAQKIDRLLKARGFE
jgi:hypothetical protein